jgi:hypothetical protein
MDAVLTSAGVSSFVSLSLSPVFRRQWPSLYRSLTTNSPSGDRMMSAYIEHLPTASQVVLAGDHTAWVRPNAVTLKDRSSVHSAVDGNSSMGIGHGYSTLVWVPEQPGSWALPLRHERITSFETPLSKAALQLKQVSQKLTVRPLALYDREYGNASFINQTADIAADLLIRVSGYRVLWGAPPAYSGRGAPRKHGDKFKLNEPSSWATPIETLTVDDPQLGQVQVTRWSRLHFQRSASREMELLRVEVLQSVGRKCKFQPLWLVYLGQTMPPLGELWRHYLRRFAVDHWYRFAKQRLHWTLPQLAEVSATEAWSALMPIMSWQLWLARDEVKDHPLPWQSPADSLSPGRVAQAFAVILAAIGTPAKPPKLRGKSQGWPPGKPRRPRTRYPTVKKRATMPKKSAKSPPLQGS